ncbi:MAG: Rrf2 family transcriptional regulator [Phycisphaerae bacterium]|nr:Rrf2 family transcriptional regulator [Phycisphaerae bacterium]
MLALTKKTGYGLIAMSHLARLKDGRVASAREISELFDVPTSLLMNVLKELSAAGYVESVRGAHGGYRLARDPGEISLADLITAVEGPIRLAECVTGQISDAGNATCRLMDRCPIADPVHRVHRKLKDFLKKVMLTDIVEPAGTLAKE